MEPLVGIPLGGTVRLTPSILDRAGLVNAGVSTGEVVGKSAAKQADTNTATRIVNQELDRDAFLQLLVLQLRNQDPLDPQSNGDMLAQLAQFSALEAQVNLNENFEILSGNIDQLNFISASTLLGRRITGIDLNGLPRTGIVDSVHLDGSVVVLSVDGELMSMAGVIQIDAPPDLETGKPEGSTSKSVKFMGENP